MSFALSFFRQAQICRQPATQDGPSLVCPLSLVPAAALHQQPVRCPTLLRQQQRLQLPLALVPPLPARALLCQVTLASAAVRPLLRQPQGPLLAAVLLLVVVVVVMVVVVVVVVRRPRRALLPLWP
jgi:hypothetical protein